TNATATTARLKQKTGEMVADLDKVTAAAGRVGTAVGSVPKIDPWTGLRSEIGATSRAMETLQSIGQSFASTLASAIGGLIDGTKSLGDTVADLGKQLGSLLLNQGLQMLLSAITGGLGGGFGGGPWAGLRLPGFARGGTILPGGA